MSASVLARLSHLFLATGSSVELPCSRAVRCRAFDAGTKTGSLLPSCPAGDPPWSPCSAAENKVLDLTGSRAGEAKSFSSDYRKEQVGLLKTIA